MLLFDGLATAGGAAVLLGLVAVGTGVVAARRYATDDRPGDRVPVGAVSPGAVATTGRVEAPEERSMAPLVPTDDADPVAVEYRVERRAPGRDAWETVATGARAVPFVVADETGRVAVELGGDREIATDQLDLGRNERRHRVTAGAPSPLHEAHADVEPRGGGDRRYAARYVEPGDRVYVEGDCDGLTAVAGDPVYLVESNEPRAFVSDAPDGPRVESPSPPAPRRWARAQLVTLGGAALLSSVLAAVAVVDLATMALTRTPVG